MLNIKLIPMIKTQDLKYKNIFAKGYTPYWSEEVFVIKKNYKYSSMGICY